MPYTPKSNLIRFPVIENISFSSYATLSPPRIATAYSIPASSGAGVKVGIVSLGGGWLQSDLDSSFADMYSAGLINTATAPTINQVLLKGASGTFVGVGGADAENTLDIYVVASMVPGASITIYITNPSNWTGLSDYAAAFQAAIDDGCDIITHSWGISERDLALGYSVHSDVFASTFANAASAGIPIVVAAGDAGSAPVSGEGEGVQYPTSSAGVISIGGTYLKLNPDNTRQLETVESVANDPDIFQTYWNGGGGISANVAIPSWQTGLTYETYTLSGGVTSGPINLTMRGVPDISAPMNAYVFYENGTLVTNGGTSAAAPLIAGVLARFKALSGMSMSSAAYNTLFYSHPTAFYDITTGIDATSGVDGYASTAGWDPVTGLGSPNGATLYALLTGASSNDATLSNLVISQGSLSPSFNASITSYSVSVSSGVSSLTITPTVNQANATVTVNGTPVTSGTASGNISLSVGANTIITVVTAQDGTTTKTYTVVVTRASGPTLSNDATLSNLVISQGSLSPSFSPSTTSYTDSVSAGITSLTITPTVNQANASVTVNGLPLTSGSVSISVAQGSNTILIVVTAQDGTTTKTYTISATVATLSLGDVTSHASIGHNDFDSIYLAIYDLLGPVSTGYGVTPLSQSRFRGSKIDAQDWNYLHDNIQQCYIHQNGSVSNSINTISKGDIVSAEYVNSLKSVVQGLTANPLTVASNQLLTTTANTVYSSDSTSFTYALYYNWATAQEIDYFFNLSGKIQPNFSATGGTADLNYVIDKLNHLYADNGNYKTSFNITLTSNTNSIVVTSSVSGPRYELSFAFTNPSGNQVNGSVTTTYSTGASGGVQAPVPVAQLLNGASLSPLPIPAFQFPVNGSQTQTMTLGNATGADITVSSISLTGYAHGSVNPTSLTVPNGTNRTFDITYTGSASGIYSGNLVLVTTDYGTVTVPTAIDVGINISLTPSASVLNTTINNNVTPVQTGFYTVSAEGTDATTYSITLSGDAGFDALGQGSSSISGGQLNPSGTPFCLNFNPVGQSNGTYSVAATINVGGASITLTWNVTISVSAPRNLGTWISSLGAYNAVLGLSYDIIQGSKCVTVGIGSNPALVDNGQNSPNIIELSGTSGSFASWQEVYRIPLTNGAYTYYPTGLYLVQKSSPWPGEVAGFTMGGSFGSGASQGSICTITDDGNGNLSILLNSLYSPDYNDTTVYQTQIDLQSCFNYYDGVAYRYTQLESGPVNGYQTHCFSGFDSNGVVQTTLVSANFPSSSGDSGGSGGE